MVIQTPKNWWGQRASCCCWKTFIALALPCSGPRIGLLCATCFLRLCARVACLIQCTLSQLLRSVTHCYFEWVMFQLFHFVFGITLAYIFFVRYDCILHLCPVFLLASKMCCIFSLLFFLSGHKRSKSCWTVLAWWRYLCVAIHLAKGHCLASRVSGRQSSITVQKHCFVIVVKLR